MEVVKTDNLKNQKDAWKERRIRILEANINDIKNNLSTYYIYIPNLNKKPNATMEYLFEFAYQLKSNGKDAKVLVDDGFKSPAWLSKYLREFPTIEFKEAVFNAKDFLFIPEVLVSSLMADFKEKEINLPCEIIPVVQTRPLVFMSLQLGEVWYQHGISNCLTTSNVMKTYMEGLNMGLQAEVINPIIPQYFYETPELKKPQILVVSRDKKMAQGIINKFHTRFPQYKWLPFIFLDSVSREQFAETMKESAIVLWLDDFATFGTAPLEAMASSSIVIGKQPDVLPEWMYEVTERDGRQMKVLKQNGVWKKSLEELDTSLAIAITMFLEDDIRLDTLYENMYNTASVYTKQNFVSQLHSTTENLEEKRITRLELDLQKVKNQ